MTSTKYQFAEKALPLFEVFSNDPETACMQDDADHLRQRFMNGGADAVPDDEMLQLILSRALPAREARSLSRRLLGTFGDFNRVMSAPSARLLQVLGVDEAILTEMKIVEATAHRMAQAKILQREVLSCWKSLLDYCTTKMAHQETEQFRVLYLDRKNILIADEAQQKGTVDHVPVYPREVVKRALELNASAIILVHNHPSGDPTPSDADIEMTRTIEIGAQTLGITIHDHLIVGKGETYSFRSNGLL